MEYTMEKLSGLLNMVSEVIQKEKTQKEEKQKRGEYFNIFSVLRLETKEVRLHSAFLAELLNPEGRHGLGKQFLELFLNMVVRKNKEEPFDFETEKAKVHVEYYIGVISEDKKSGGRIDLLIEDGKGNAIIIENKINAGDQEYQLLRYNNFAKKSKGNYKYKLLYLTKDGDEASEYSTGKEDFEYQCISYRNNILPWLECCEQAAVRHPLIRETIHQYIVNLKEILNIMEKNTQDSLFDRIVENKEYILGVLFLKDNLGGIQCKMWENVFIKQICNAVAKDNEMVIHSYGSPESTQYMGVSFKKEGWNYVSVSFEFLSNGFKNFIYGIKFRDPENEKKDEIKEKLPEELTNMEGVRTSNWYPWLKIDEDFPNWEEDAIKALYDGNMKKHIESKLQYLVTIINKNLGDIVMNKIIFLDFDGVLNTEHYQGLLMYQGKPWQDKYGALFDPSAVKHLKEIIEVTHADIVIESSWKVLGLEAMQRMWTDRQLPGRVIDVTDSHVSDKWLLDAELDDMDPAMRHCKGTEIASWLAEHTDGDVRYVIIDDEEVCLKSQIPHFILTNPYDGITRDIADRAIALLDG